MPELNETNLTPDAGVSIPRISLGEKGYTGLRVSNSQIYEESRQDLRWPQAINTFKQMSSDATIAAGLNLFKMMISRVPWSVQADKDASDKTKERAKFISTCMNDMDHSWFQFIQEVTSVYNYGFSVNEKVFRRRLNVNGSKYNDGLVGLKKLPIRSQSTISKFDFDGRELQSVTQNTTLIRSNGMIVSGISPEIEIKRNKFLLFRTNVENDNPQGQSPLCSVYSAWRYRRELEEAEAVRLERGLGGVPYFGLPPKYLDPDATVAEKAVLEQIQNIGRNLKNGQQSCIVFPHMIDPESRQELFKFEILNPEGLAQDSDKVIKRWDDKILQCLYADILQLGNKNMGSYSLADSKSSLVAMAIEFRLKEIQDVLNSDLIPSLYEMNGWDKSEMPYFQYGDLEQKDVSIFAKALQQLKATSLIVPSAKNINHIAEVVGLPDRVDDDIDQEELNGLLGNMTSRSGDGAAAGGINGTSSSVSEEDNSASNLDNK